jgi:hypothetical protein
LRLLRVTLFFAGALSLMAQTDTPQSESTQSDTTQSNAAPSGEEYGGPAILSRGEVPGAPSSAPIAFRPFIGLNGIYDNGLIPVSVNSNGRIPTANLFGVELNLGLYGYHTWKHTTVALDYKGNFRHYSQQTYYDGTDQFLSLIVKHEPTKRLIFTLKNTAGTYSRNYFLSSTLGILDPNYLELPENDIYDNRVIFLTTAGDMIYRMTSRLSFDLGGEGYIVRRQSTALYGLTGYDAHGDLQYRLRRHTTIGADYRFTHFEYTQGFGNSYIHSIGLNYSTRLTRHVQFSTRLGGARVESASLEQVTLDPAIAALLGVSVGIQAVHQVHYVPDLTARLTDTFRGSQLTLSFNDNVNPGNGVYLTSRMESGIVSYSYTGVRHWNFGVDAGYTRLSALIQTLGAYDSYGVGGGVTRDLRHGLHAVLRLDARRYNVAADEFQRTDFRAMLGLTWSPGDVPLALW